MLDHKRKLVVLSSKKAIDYFDSKQLASAHVLATSPDVKALLKRKGVSHYDTTEFFGVVEHEQLLLSSHAGLASIKQFLPTDYPDSLVNQISFEFIGFIRFYLYHYILISSVVSKLEVSHISMDVALDSQTLRLYALERNLDLKFYSEKVQTSFMSKHAKYFLRLYNHMAVWYINSFLKNRSLVLLPSFTSKYSKITDEISFNCSYVYLNSNARDIKRFLKNILNDQYLLASYGCLLSKSEYNDAINLALKIKFDERLKAESYGFDLKSLMQQFLSGLDVTVVNYMRIDRLLRKIICNNKVSLAFTDNALGMSGQLGEQCVKNNVPSMLISHGSHVVTHCANAKLEWALHAKTILNATFGHLAIQTPHAEVFLANENKIYGKTVKTGPLILCRSSETSIRDECFEKQCKDKVVFLHASTPKPMHYLRPWVYETIDEYIRNINDIIQIVNNNKDAYLAIRFRPQAWLCLEDFKSLLIPSENYDLYCDNSLNDYLLHADYLISYSSTTIEEALHAKVPVVQYDPDGKYHHITGINLKRPECVSHADVYTISSREDLDWGIKQLVLTAKEKRNEDLDFSKHVMHDKTQRWLDEVLSKI